MKKHRIHLTVDDKYCSEFDKIIYAVPEEKGLRTGVIGSFSSNEILTILLNLVGYTSARAIVSEALDAIQEDNEDINEENVFEVINEVVEFAVHDLKHTMKQQAAIEFCKLNKVHKIKPTYLKKELQTLLRFFDIHLSNVAKIDIDEFIKQVDKNCVEEKEE